MKKTFISFLLCLLTACIFPAERTANPALIINTEPEYTLNSGNDMDALWAKYYETEDEVFLDTLIAYVNTENVFERKINEEYTRICADEKCIAALENLDAVIQDDKIYFPYDIETVVGFLLQNEKYNEDIKYLYSFFPQELLIRGVMKSTAYWSLYSNAGQNNDIKIALQKRIPYLREQIQDAFYQSEIGKGLKGPIGFVRSETEKDSTYFGNDALFINAVLTNDIEDAMHQWDTLKPEEAPRITTSRTVTKEKNKIAPFIVYGIKTHEDFPIYYDLEVIDPNGTISQNSLKKILFSKQKPENLQYLYTAFQYGYVEFTPEDPSGAYTIKLTFYTDEYVILVTELGFSVEI